MRLPGGQFALGSLMDPVSAIAGGTGLVGNVVGGILGRGAANKAGALQQQAANEAASNVQNTAGQGNVGISNAAANAGSQVSTAAGGAADLVQNAGNDAGNVATAAAGNANSLLNPYAGAGATAAGALNGGLAAGGAFNKTPTMADITIDPGYQWRQQQGELALNRSAAARGGAVSGAALQDLANYSQGLASQEYGNAFNRYETDLNSRYQRLFGTAGLGAQAAQQQGQNLIGTSEYAGNAGLQGTMAAGNFRTSGAEYAGNAGMNAANLTAANANQAATTAANLTTGGAAARAAGIVGGTNALTQGIAGGVNAGSSALTLSRLLQNPAAPSVNVGNLPTNGIASGNLGWTYGGIH